MRIIRARIIGRSTYDPYQELADAVVLRAALDYRVLRKELETSGSRIEKKRIENEIELIRRFFLSDWYCELSGYQNGPMILKKLGQEVLGCD